MAPTSLFSTTTALIVRNATSREKRHFKILWGDHLKLRDEGKIVYFLPHNWGTKMGSYHLQDVAARLR
jgi:hypothetical protein